MKAVIEKKKCPSDPRMCQPLKACPNKAITWVEDEDEPIGSRMEIDASKCNGCGVCVALCCGHCISLQ
jgi:Pyruvate/2-oxoacid:ferredoxin oxidoreductase delta subunit